MAPNPRTPRTKNVRAKKGPDVLMTSGDMVDDLPLVESEDAIVAALAALLVADLEHHPPVKEPA